MVKLGFLVNRTNHPAHK